MRRTLPTPTVAPMQPPTRPPDGSYEAQLRKSLDQFRTELFDYRRFFEAVKNYGSSDPKPIHLSSPNIQAPGQSDEWDATSALAGTLPPDWMGSLNQFPGYVTLMHDGETTGYIFVLQAYPSILHGIEYTDISVVGYWSYDL